MKEACLFDLYDTLVYLDEREYKMKIQRMSQLADADPEDFAKAWKSLVVSSNLGEIATTKDRALATLSILAMPRDDNIASKISDEEHRFLRENSYLYDDALYVLEELRRCGVRTALVTNASVSVWEVIRSKKLELVLDVICISSAYGVRKPDAQLYQHALRELSVPPDKALFVGDGNDRELDGAKSIGITTVHIDRKDDFRAVTSIQSDEKAIDFRVESLKEILTLIYN